MGRLIYLAVILYASVQMSATLDTNSSYVYNYKLPKVSADIFLQLKDRLTFRVVDVVRTVEEESKYVNGLYELRFMIAEAQLVGSCKSESDLNALQNYTDTFKTALTGCFDQLNSTEAFSVSVDEIVSELKAVDKQIKNQVDSCSSNTSCETLAYTSMYQLIESLYVHKIPELRLAEDRATADSLASIQSCMNLQVNDTYDHLLKDISTIQACLANSTQGASDTQDEKNGTNVAGGNGVE